MVGQKKVSFEVIGKYFYEDEMSISYIEYKHGVSRDRVIELLDEYDRKYNAEKYLNTPQVKDLVQGIYLYKAQTYDILGVISEKYTRSCKIEVIDGDKLPSELLGVIILPMNGRLTIREKEFMEAKDYLKLPNEEKRDFSEFLEEELIK